MAAAAADPSYLEDDEALARRLQQEELGQLYGQGANPNQNVVGGGGDPAAAVQAPLLNNANANANGPIDASEQNRVIRQNIIEATRQREVPSPKYLLFLTACAIIEIAATSSILSICFNASCVNLKWWLALYSARLFFEMPLQIHVYRVRNDIQAVDRALQLLKWIDIYRFIWFLVGQALLFSDKSCQNDSNESAILWYYTLSIVVITWISVLRPFLVVLAICICLPCVLLVYRFFAEQEAVAIIEKLPTRKFEATEKKKDQKERPTTIGDNEDDDDEDDDDESSEEQSCSICIMPYQNGDEIRILPCGHEFHSKCIDTWLPIRKICPLCRHDVSKPRPESSQYGLNNNGNVGDLENGGGGANNENDVLAGDGGGGGIDEVPLASA